MRAASELNQNELEELRSRFFDQLVEQGENTKDGILGDIGREEDLPMSNVIEHYEGTFFVEEDFFCNTLS